MDIPMFHPLFFSCLHKTKNESEIRYNQYCLIVDMLEFVFISNSFDTHL
jgi:hypothetical protein